MREISTIVCIILILGVCLTAESRIDIQLPVLEIQEFNMRSTVMFGLSAIKVCGFSDTRPITNMKEPTIAAHFATFAQEQCIPRSAGPSTQGQPILPLSIPLFAFCLHV